MPLLCDYGRVTSVQIFTRLKDIGQNPFVYGLVTVALLYEILARGQSASAATATPAAQTTTAAAHPIDHAHLLLYAAIAEAIYTMRLYRRRHI